PPAHAPGAPDAGVVRRRPGDPALVRRGAAPALPRRREPAAREARPPPRDGTPRGTPRAAPPPVREGRQPAALLAAVRARAVARRPPRRRGDGPPAARDPVDGPRRRELPFARGHPVEPAPARRSHGALPVRGVRRGPQ